MNAKSKMNTLFFNDNDNQYEPHITGAFTFKYPQFHTLELHHQQHSEKPQHQATQEHSLNYQHNREPHSIHSLDDFQPVITFIYAHI